MGVPEQRAGFFVTQRKGPRHIALSRIGGEVLLRRGRAAAHEAVQRQPRARALGDSPRQQGRLVETPPEEPAPVQGHGRQDRGPLEHGAGGARHPAAEHPRKLGAVAMLETDDHRVAGVVINDSGAGPVEIRRRGDAGRTFNLRAIVGGKRDAAAPAGGIFNEMRRAPGRRPDGPRRGELLARQRTMRRHGEIERAARRFREAAFQPSEDLRFHVR